MCRGDVAVGCNVMRNNLFTNQEEYRREEDYQPLPRLLFCYKTTAISSLIRFLWYTLVNLLSPLFLRLSITLQDDFKLIHESSGGNSGVFSGVLWQEGLAVSRRDEVVSSEV